jgi:hypothetical protein
VDILAKIRGNRCQKYLGLPQTREGSMKQGGSVIQPILMVLFVVVGVVWLVGALNAGNLIWWLPVQPTFAPSRIVVRNRGETINLQPGTEGFTELQEGLQASLSSFDNADLVPLGLSEETLRRYNEEELVVEVYYPRNIRFNTIARMERVNQLLIPIEGTHAGNRHVFIGYNGRWLAGALVMSDDQPLHDALRGLGYE